MDRLYRIEHHGRSGSAVERDGALRELSGDPFGSYTAGAEIAGGLKEAGLKLLPPVTPSKIVCVGLNNKDHPGETGKPLPAEPLLFMQPSTAVIGPGQAVW